MEDTNNLTNKIQKYEDITNEILDKNPKEMFRESKKFLSLCETFNIDADGMEENIIKMKEQQKELLTPEFIKNNEDKELDLIDVISTDNLKQDISLIRDNLRANVKAIGTILGKYGDDLIASHADDVSGSVLMGYSELVKSHTNSMKLLMDIHKTSAQTLVELKKLVSQAEVLDSQNNQGNQGDITNNTNNTINFIGTPQELLESLKNS